MIGGRTAFARLLAVAALAAILCSIGQPALAYEHRASTPSFGFQFGYGKLIKGERFYVENYPREDGRLVSGDYSLSETNKSWGPSGHISLRFALDRSHAVGFGFEDIRYKRKTGYTADQKVLIPNWVKFTTFHVDYYLYFERRKKTSYYLAPLVGIQQRELRYKGSEVQVQEYKFLYGGNLGVEYFIRRTFSIDLSGHLFALRGGKGTSVVLQPALGFHLYVM